MTRAEAINRLETCLDCTDCLTCADHDEAIKVLLESYLKALESLEQREQGCEFCKRFDFASAKVEVNKYGAHICLASAGTFYATNEQLKFCPVCGRRLED